MIDDERQELADEVETPAISAGAVLASSDWTTQTLLDQMRRGNIDLDPVFQRRDAWQSDRKAQFIESLFLGLPVPQLVLAERKEKRGTYIIIDGKQRLLTLAQFAAQANAEIHTLILRGLRVLPELNGLNYEQLRERPDLDEHLTSFENQTIRTVIIRAWPTEAFLYTVFLRLNTGSLPLSPQELRQALHPGPFTRYINTFTENNEPLKNVLNLTKPDFRMRDTELVIRYLAFRNFLAIYTGNLKPLLDKVVIYFNDNQAEWDTTLNPQLNEFTSALEASSAIFGVENAFRKWNGQKYERSINRAVFDIMMASFSHPLVAQTAVEHSPQVQAAFKALCDQNGDFRNAIERTTKSIAAIYARMSIWVDTLQEVLNVPIPAPRLVDNRILL